MVKRFVLLQRIFVLHIFIAHVKIIALFLLYSFKIIALYSCTSYSGRSKNILFSAEMAKVNHSALAIITFYNYKIIFTF